MAGDVQAPLHLSGVCICLSGCSKKARLDSNGDFETVETMGKKGGSVKQTLAQVFCVIRNSARVYCVSHLGDSRMIK